MPSDPSLFSHIAAEMHDTEQIQKEIDAQKRERPELEEANVSGGTYVAPRTPNEKRLAAIWAEFLGLERVGIYDGFFALGGHSIMAVQILARGRKEFQVEIPMEVIFAGDFTVEEIARVIDEYQICQADPDEIAALVEELEGLSDEEVQALLANDGLDGMPE